MLGGATLKRLRATGRVECLVPDAGTPVSGTRSAGPATSQVKEDMGNALGIAQFGGTAPTAKPWKGLGPGVLEVVESHDGNAYRAVYTIRFEKAVYVLDAFQKKSLSGIRTAKGDVDLVAQRLRTAEKDYEEHYGKSKS